MGLYTKVGIGLIQRSHKYIRIKWVGLWVWGQTPSLKDVHRIKPELKILIAVILKELVLYVNIRTFSYPNVACYLPISKEGKNFSYAAYSPKQNNVQCYDQVPWVKNLNVRI